MDRSIDGGVTSDDRATQDALLRRVEAGCAPGYAVGIVDRHGESRTWTVGNRDSRGERPIDRDTIFEIGSITKVFTTLLLARMNSRGFVAIDDPVRKHIPCDAQLIEMPGEPISLEHLATHTSGLARMPTDIQATSLENPYDFFDVPHLYRFLALHRPPAPPGTACTYSNLGMALLGHALAHREGSDYESATHASILEPLSMSSTCSNPRPEDAERTATGHDATIPVSAWNIPGLAPAGNLRSSLDDMLRFAAASLDPGTTDLHRDLARGQEPRHRFGNTDVMVGLGWKVEDHGDRRLFWHNGGTGGFASYLGCDRRRGSAVVVLCNSNDRTVDDVGRHLLGLPHGRLDPFEIEHDALNEYTGRFETVDADGILTIGRSGGRLRITFPGQPIALTADATATDEFTARVANAPIRFLRGIGGAIHGLEVAVGDRPRRFTRIDDATGM